MKKLRVLAFLAAIGLFAFGCGETLEEAIGGGDTKNAPITEDTPASEADKLIAESIDPDTGKTTQTAFIDPDTGKTVEKLSDIKTSAVGDTPPLAPTFARPAGSSPVPSNLPAPPIASR